jgi:predicted GNAT family acetyltransferase
MAGALVDVALSALRQRGLRVIPLCPFVRAWLDRHPEYADLVISDPATPH